MSVDTLPVHRISGYEWDCDECHTHFTGRPCYITGKLADRDEYVDSREYHADHEALLDRAQVLAAVNAERLADALLVVYDNGEGILPVGKTEAILDAKAILALLEDGK